MSQELQVILGSGPVGCHIARTLREQNIPVRAVNRSGQRPALMPADVEMIAADITNRGEAIAAAQGAAVLYQALNPPYHQWHETFLACRQAHSQPPNLLEPATSLSTTSTCTTLPRR